MLDTETKRRIDEARDILVGKLPDPKSQVEQITIALIYKFMYDMDKEALDFGGKATFFTGEWEKYNWVNIFDPKIGGHEMLALYGEAIVKLNQNPNIPQLFRDIFKNAYLPYRDPETLKLFLKTINGFTYDHSERLGDAFEYLLSVLGSQGDAGQFRTPRHIIDFMVAVLQPKKNETICDPACGTAGFLISSYKYIVDQNTKKNKGDLLTPDDKKKMMQRFTGYDISPDMVRLSLVNMYLHNFTTPKIYEYDTLTSEERWNESFDIIMANPPFMSPKGGIKPHKKFTMQANRSEVLFVDYIAEHINPATGRAGIIVPEGIIFQSANAYKQLRQLLIDKKFLYAVVSLPAGIFQPYSGVKTSVLLMDRALAKKTDNILFVKIENDGFDLGAQRRAIDKNDLTAGLVHLQEYKEAVLNNTEFTSDNKNAFVVDKKIIKGTGDYNLSVDRYRVNENVKLSDFKMVKIGDVAELEYGFTDVALDEGDVRFVRITDINEEGLLKETDKKFIKLNDDSKKFLLNANDLLVARTGATFGKTLIYNENYPSVFASYLIRIKFKANLVVPKFYWAFTKTEQYWKEANELVSGGGQPQFNANAIKEIIFPLPPLSIQQQIVDKIESYQAIINGAKQVVQNYKPQIDIDPEWEMVKLAEVFKLSSGKGLTQQNLKEGNYPVYGGNGINGYHNEYFVEKPIIVIGRVGAYCGAVQITQPKSWITDNGLYVTEYLRQVNQNYVAQMLTQLNLNQFAKVGGQPSISQNTVYELKIPLPSLSIQLQIVNRIEQEQQLVNANKELIKIYEQKIKDEINKLWKPAVKEYKMEEERVSVAAEE